MKQLYIIAVTLGMMFMTACSSDEPTADNTRRDIELTQSEIIVSEDMSEFNTELFKAFAEIEDKDDNLILSPFSISSYLSMQANYCSNITQEQIFKALGSSNLDALNSFNAKIIAKLGKLDKSTTLNLANSVWFDQRFSLKPTAKDNLPDFFDADIFSCDPENTITKSRINNWIKQKTNDKITDFYDGTPFASMVINVLYFNSIWKDKFIKEDTEKQKFHVGEKIYMVDMMKRLNATEEIAKGRNFTACRRDFGNGAYKCTFILPDEDCDINDFIAGISYNELSALKFANTKCDLYVPKFELRNKSNKLLKVFSTLGIYGIDTPLEVSAENIIAIVRHESYIKLDEEGAKVAAATGDVIYWEALDPDKVYFRLDRPFIFMINETSTNACILTGRISKFK